jgi:hypothetical protein
LLFVKFVKPAAAGAAPVADVTLSDHPTGSDPDPGGLPVPAEQESSDEITRSARRGRRPDALTATVVARTMACAAVSGCLSAHA